MITVEPFPCRVTGIPARDAPVIALLRRGPTEWTRLILWHTDDDRLDGGQWFHGRIYEWRCALSPDGQLLVYFAAKRGRGAHADPSYTTTWTAVSRPPYLTALALWPKGDTWNGGGVFDGDRTLRLNHERGRPHPKHPATGLRVIAGQANPWFTMDEGEGVHTAFIESLGWRLAQAGRIDDRREQMMASLRGENQGPDGKRRSLIVQATVPLIRERIRPGGGYRLRWTWYGVDYNQRGSNQVVDYTVLNDQTGAETPLPALTTWADWDQRGRLAYTESGRLYAAPPDQIGAALEPLVDLNDQQPSRLKAPAWATRWPAAARQPEGRAQP